MKKLVLKVLSRLKLIHYLNLYVTSKDGIIVPVLGGLGYSNVYGTEKWMCKVLSKVLPEVKGSFVDVGVNIGQTLIKVKSIDKDHEYLGFEPSPTCVYYAEKLVEANKFPRTNIIPTGISNASEMVTLKYFSSAPDDSSASIIENFKPTTAVVQEKNIIVLNSDVIKIPQRIGILKIDVEGAESMVLEAFESFISRDRPLILIEVLPVYNVENKERLERQNSIIRLMQKVDYVILRIMKNQDDTLKEAVQIADIGIHSDVTQCDYILAPKEQASRIMQIVKG